MAQGKRSVGISVTPIDGRRFGQVRSVRCASRAVRAARREAGSAKVRHTTRRDLRVRPRTGWPPLDHIPGWEIHRAAAGLPGVHREMIVRYFLPLRIIASRLSIDFATGEVHD